MKPYPKNKPYRINRKTSAGKQEYKALLGAIWGRDRGICQICYRDTIVPHYHHVIFRSQGGGDTIDNMLILCNQCHHIIHHGPRHSAEYRQRAVERMGKLNGNANKM